MTECVNTFPVENGQVLYAASVNLLYGNFIGMRSTEAETAMNIAKLQYCQSVTDISHDYMVVDVFTDSSGYNNTIVGQSCYTTGLTGIATCTADGGTVGDYSVISCVTQDTGTDVFDCAIGWACFQPVCWDRVKEFGYNLCCLVQHIVPGSTSCPTGCYCFELCDSDDNVAGCAILVNATNCVNSPCNIFNALNCYKYVYSNVNCWDFYCNGTCKCQVTRIDFPGLCTNTYAFQSQSLNSSGKSLISISCFYYCDDLLSTSTYCSSALNGYYINNNVSLVNTVAIQDCATNNTNGSECYGNFYSCVYANSASGCWGTRTQIIADCCNLFDKDCYGIEFSICMISCSRYGCLSTTEVIFPTSIDCRATGHSTAGITCYSELRCYKFLCASANCFDFYCNGTCKCQVTISSDPILCIRTSAEVWACTSSWLWTCAYLVNSVQYNCLGSENLKIVTIPTIYPSTPKTSYLTTEQVGTGTVVYNVLDASDDSCIACNLPVNTLNSLDCCVACHKYEIIQCSDGVSCIKSYAILAGVY